MKYLDKKFLIIIASIVIVLFSVAIYIVLNNNGKNADTSEVSLKEEDDFNLDDKNEKTGTIKAEIKGEVVSPGVYELNDGSRLDDLVACAGGFKKNAYTDDINLSMKVNDEMVLYVYNKKTKKKILSSNKLTKQDESNYDACYVSSYNIDKCTENGKSTIIIDSEKKSINTNETTSSDVNVSSSENAENNTSELININTASLNELTTLPGIGDAKAQDIIDYRKANGGFKTIEDIMNVSGIGKATYEKFKANIKV